MSAIRRVMLKTCYRLSDRIPGSPTPVELASLVESADWYLPGSRTCLVRSLTAETLLRLYGYSPVHQIGVKKDTTDELEAHSWIEYEDDILLGDLEDLSAYSRLPPLDRGD